MRVSRLNKNLFLEKMSNNTTTFTLGFEILHWIRITYKQNKIETIELNGNIVIMFDPLEYNIYPRGRWHGLPNADLDCAAWYLWDDTSQTHVRCQQIPSIRWAVNWYDENRAQITAILEAMFQRIDYIKTEDHPDLQHSDELLDLDGRNVQIEIVDLPDDGSEWQRIDFGPFQEEGEWSHDYDSPDSGSTDLDELSEEEIWDPNKTIRENRPPLPPPSPEYDTPERCTQGWTLDDHFDELDDDIDEDE